MRVLLIDNYDSFTYNLADQIERLTGAAPMVRRNDALAFDAIERLRLDAIVLSPGPGRPDRQRDFGVCRDVVLRGSVPCLGVCLGHQGIAACWGGELIAAEPPMHGLRSRVFHDGADIFAGVPQGFDAVRYHSLTVSRHLPDALELAAWTDDGSVMALRHRSRRLWGVQFHPESVRSEQGDRILKNFLSLAGFVDARRVAVPAASASTAQVERGASTPPRRRLELLCTELDVSAAPEDVYAALYAGAPESFWLDGNDRRRDSWGTSYMGCARGPLAYSLSYRSSTRTLTLRRGDGVETREEPLFDFLRRALAEHEPPRAELPFDFTGGFVGYLGYEMKADCGAPAPHASPLPDAHLVFCDRFVALSEDGERIWLVALCDAATRADAERWARATASVVSGLASRPPSPRRAPERVPAFALRVAESEYLDAIDRCQSRIREGESYELCLTTAMTAPALARPFEAYRALRLGNRAPFSAYLKTPDCSVLSSSPELFLRVDRDGRVTSRPIKGTVRRDARPDVDDALRRSLGQSEKDQAENLMIVDLVRNDLGRVCAPGSVEVPELMVVESFAQVHQLVSTVQGRLRSGATAVDCIASAFPPGSMTGAPKLRSMELLDELEGEARGVYSGAIGYLGLGGEARLSVVIRTLIATPAGSSIGVGGAITLLSRPEDELAEILVKGHSVAGALVATADAR